MPMFVAYQILLTSMMQEQGMKPFVALERPHNLIKHPTRNADITTDYIAAEKFTIASPVTRHHFYHNLWQQGIDHTFVDCSINMRKKILNASNPSTRLAIETTMSLFPELQIPNIESIHVAENPLGMTSRNVHMLRLAFNKVSQISPKTGREHDVIALSTGGGAYFRL